MNLNSENEILVSICCLTYNHAPYIRQCLDGFMMQKTTFQFEVLIHDDASTDGTTNIIREYESKYPSQIKPIYEDHNQWVLGRKGSAIFNFPRAQGKYIAMCEGDDYWTDPYKLQKQVDFLESHPDYTLCFHNAIEHWEKGENEDSLFVKGVTNSRDYTGYEILEIWTIPTASVVFKKSVIDSDLYQKAVREPRFLFGDIVLFLTNAEFGKLHYINETMSVYRRQENGMVFTFNYDHQKKMPDHYQAIISIFGEKYTRILSPKFFSYLYFRLCLESKQRKFYKWSISYFVQSFFKSPSGFYLAFKQYLKLKFFK